MVLYPGSLSFEEVTILKALLRALQRLMQTAGTTEGLRNLVDTSLLGSVKLIIQNRAMFGSQVFALGTSFLYPLLSGYTLTLFFAPSCQHYRNFCAQ